MHSILFVSCYTDRGDARGIYTCALDRADSTLACVSEVDDRFNPSYLALAPDGRHLYAANEIDGEAMITVYRIGPSNQLAFAGRQSYPGGALCSINIHPKHNTLFAANYAAGSVLSVRIAEGGGAGELLTCIEHQGSGPNPDRQAVPHAHCAVPDPAGRFLHACDLGTDTIYRCEIAPSGQLIPSGGTLMAPGDGPRHLIFDRAGARAFAVTELSNQVVSYAYDAGSGALTEKQRHSIVPERAAGLFNAADVQLSPDERTLYASLRGISGGAVGGDGIAVFRAHGTDLLPDGFIPTGALPRSFAVSPCGKYLVVACQGADRVQVIDVASRLAVAEIRIPLPVCVKFAIPQKA